MPSEINCRFSITLLQSSQCLERTISLEKLTKSDELRSKNVTYHFEEKQNSLHSTLKIMVNKTNGSLKH